MSYAGTYGADETCRHNSYWRSCAACSLVGPRATEKQIQAALQRRQEEIAASQRREAELRRMYEELDPEEKAAAEALWNRSNVSLADAVAARVKDSWYIGKGREACRQARTALAAARAVSR